MIAWRRALRRAAIFAVLAGTLWLNLAVLAEAYGAGPPFYGRTTNMDKWASPWPWLAPIDLVAGVAVLLLARSGRRADG